MFKFLTRLLDPDGEDIAALLRAFPADCADDVRVVAGVLPLRDHKIISREGSSFEVDHFVPQVMVESVRLESSQVEIPYRVYLNEASPRRIAALAERQRAILNCIYSRSHDGFVRQKHLQQLEHCDEPFVCPFVIRLLGEYVIEIFETIDRLIDDRAMPHYVAFLRDNKQFWIRTMSRVASYWGEYYRRRDGKFADYPAQRTVLRIKKAMRELPELGLPFSKDWRTRSTELNTQSPTPNGRNNCYALTTAGDRIHNDHVAELIRAVHEELQQVNSGFE